LQFFLLILKPLLLNTVVVQLAVVVIMLTSGPLKVAQRIAVVVAQAVSNVQAQKDNVLLVLEVVPVLVLEPDQAALFVMITVMV
jgi:hypothetical protein